MINERIQKYVDDHSFCSEYLFTDWEAFLDFIYMKKVVAFRPSGGNSSSGSDSSSNNNTSNEDSNSSSTNSSNNSSDSNSSTSSETVSKWTPKTPDEIKRYSVVGTEVLTPFVDKSSGYTLTLKNAMQGPSCYAVFESVLNGYTIGRTYDIFPNGQRVQSTDKEIGFSIEVPKALQKEGRTFQMICVTKGGQPVILKDLDSHPNTVTIKTNKFYAVAHTFFITHKGYAKMFVAFLPIITRYEGNLYRWCFDVSYSVEVLFCL